MRSVIRAGLVLSTAVILLNACFPADVAARLNDGRWRLLDVGATRPAPRRHSTLVYDSANHRVLMYGGDDAASGQVFGDVWSLELGCEPHWVQLSTSGTPPTPRHGHVAVYVPGNPGKMIVNGGNTAIAGLPETEEISPETWELRLDTNVWTKRADKMMDGNVLLSPRLHHTAVYHRDAVSNDDCMYVFGGRFPRSSTGLSELLQYNVRTYTWKRLCGEFTLCSCNGTGPIGRYWHSHIHDTARDRMVVFGGKYDDTDPSDVWDTDAATPDWCPGSSDKIDWFSMGTAANDMSRIHHVAIFDPIATPKRMIVFGGKNPTQLNAIVGSVTALPLPDSATTGWTTLNPDVSMGSPGPLAEGAAV